jgi:NAD(P)-dependent dehydrogenase (short-subunit alcohol dehydrogenase family)
MDFSMFELTDRVAIVTGAGSGLGRAIALQLARAGANVVVAGISINDRGVVADPSQSTVALDNTTKQIQTLGRKALSIVTDVRESAQVDNMVQKTVEKFGHIDSWLAQPRTLLASVRRCSGSGLNDRPSSMT